jgi:hypothetical protein
VGNGEPLPLHSMVGCHLPAILQGSQVGLGGILHPRLVSHLVRRTLSQVLRHRLSKPPPSASQTWTTVGVASYMQRHLTFRSSVVEVQAHARRIRELGRIRFEG